MLENTRYPARNQENYYEEPVPEDDDDDDYHSCDEFNQEEGLPVHGPLVHIRDVEVPPSDSDLQRAEKTAPDCIAIADSSIPGEGKGAWTTMPLQKGVVFGPYEGFVTDTTKMSGYGWQIQLRRGSQIYVDAWDPRVSNWMRYVNCPRNEEEQNMLAFQFNGQIYYKIIKDVPMHTELLVWHRGRTILQPADDDVAESSRSAKPAKPLLAGAERILLWIFILLCLNLIAVLLWLVAGVISSLSARNQALTNQNLALHRAMNALQRNIDVRGMSSVQDYNVRKVVEQQLAVYDADKIGLADYALESQGGAVLETPDTVTYCPDSWFKLLGFHLFRFRPCNGPSRILQPSMQPDNCWAFEGTRGSVQIRLARPIYIIAVTIEHIPSSIAISGYVSSAPKKFLIAALEPRPGKSFFPHTLGMYEYKISGPPLQSFRIQNAEFSEKTSLLQLSVLDNHGNPAYTCIYRFRVHGHEALMSPSGGSLP